MAGFIGRTNFLEGAGRAARCASTASRPRAGLEGRQRKAGFYSLRPQAIVWPHKPNGGHLVVEAEIAGRSYLGEYWDYQVKPLGAAKPLRVSTGPNAVFGDRPAASGWRSIHRPWYG